MSADPLESLHIVVLNGSFEQMLPYISDNEDVTAVISDSLVMITDPAAQVASGMEAKAMNLKGSTEAITQVSIPHNLGYDGSGTVIAVLDSGINKNHEQFRGRVITEYCFSKMTPVMAR